MDIQIVDAVIDSWITVTCIPNYEQVVGEILFRKFFELAPSVLTIFPFGEDFREREEELYQSEVFQRHATGVLRMLDRVINMLGPDDSEFATKKLADLGARHTTYGVLPVHFEVIEEALIYTLSTALGIGWTWQAEEGWRAVYEYISSAMIEGASREMQKPQTHRERLRKQIYKVSDDEPSRILQPTVGKHDSSQRLPKATQSLGNSDSTYNGSVWNDKKQVLALIDDAHNMSVSDIGSESTECADPEEDDSYYRIVVENVNRSWEKIKAIAEYETVVGVLVFKKVFEIAPDAKALFSFYDAKNSVMQEEAFYELPAFVRHAVAVVRMLDVAVHMLGPDLDPVSEALRGLGERHVEYGVTTDHYPVVGEALLSTLEELLGDAWTNGARLGWTTIFSFMSSTMIQGANAAATETL